MKFEVKLDGQWVPALHGYILADGRLGYTTPDRRGVAPGTHWRLSEETTRDPDFREMLWHSLSYEERRAALARMAVSPYGLS